MTLLQQLSVLLLLLLFGCTVSRSASTFSLIVIALANIAKEFAESWFGKRKQTRRRRGPQTAQKTADTWQHPVTSKFYDVHLPYMQLWTSAAPQESVALWLFRRYSLMTCLRSSVSFRTTLQNLASLSRPKRQTMFQVWRWHGSQAVRVQSLTSVVVDLQITHPSSHCLFAIDIITNARVTPQALQSQQLQKHTNWLLREHTLHMCWCAP
jgi:hypothetical protein